MRMACIKAIIIFCFLSARSYFAESGAVEGNACPLSTVALELNMTRLEAERRISAALGKPNKYSPYDSNLSGGTTKYEAANCTLIVSYAEGRSAPMVSVSGSGVEHMAPKDETVSKFELVKRGSDLP